MSTLRVRQAALGAAMACAVGLLGVPSDTRAAPITFLFQSTIDATNFGGAINAPFRVEYSFDSGLLSGSGPGGGSGSYGPISGILTVGSESVTFGGSGAGILVIDNIGFEDRYDVRASGFTSFSGTLFGLSLNFFNFAIIGADLNMFASNALPTSPAFALNGDPAQMRVEAPNCPNNCLFTQVRAPEFSLSSVPVPAPATLPLLATGIGVMAWLGWRKRRQARVLALAD